MKGIKRSLGVVGLAAAFAFVGVAPASAVTEYVGGGVWNHYTYQDLSQVISVSNYKHSTKEHKASVTSPVQYTSSGWKQPGYTAAASQPIWWLGGNKANYDYR